MTKSNDIPEDLNPPPPRTREAPATKAGEIPIGGGSTPDPADPATEDPLHHLDDLPGVSESPPSPGQGEPEPAPTPPPPPPEPPPPPASRRTL